MSITSTLLDHQECGRTLRLTRPGRLSAPYSQLTVGLRCHLSLPILGSFGWESERSLEMDLHHGWPHTCRSTDVSPGIPPRVPKPCPSSDGLACPIPTGAIGSPAPRGSNHLPCRGGRRRRVASQLRPPLAAPLGVWRFLVGRARRARAQARFFPLATRRLSKRSLVKPSARPSCH